jgi:hypothetical protein
MDVFTPIAAESRIEKRRAYREYLRSRDGVVDVASHTLSKREVTMKRFLACDREGARSIDADVFERQCVRFDPRCPMSLEELLLLALVKINAAEAWGVNRTLERAKKRAERSEDDTQLVLLIEEAYHTKILLSSARLYGLRLDVAEPFPPHPAVRALVSCIATMPEAWSRVLTLAAEILGVVIFANLLEVTRRVLQCAPVVRDAIEERLTEVLIDEIGHVSFLRLSVGPTALAQAKRLLPLMVRGVANGVPEVAALGAWPTSPLENIATLETRLSEEITRNAFIA